MYFIFSFFFLGGGGGQLFEAGRLLTFLPSQRVLIRGGHLFVVGALN